MKHPIRRRLMYLGFQGLRALIQLLPLEAARAVGRTLGLAAYGLLGAQRRLTLQHLEYAFQESLEVRSRRRIARRVFTNLGQSAMEWLLLPTRSMAQIQALVTSEGVEHLRQAMAQGNGAIMVTAHFGNWELIPLYLRGLGFEGGVLARRLRYPEYESFLITLRGSRGVHTFARGSLKEVAKVLRSNQIIGMLPDQDMDSLDGVFVNFFGHPAYTPVGPAALSLMAGAPMLPCFLIRDGARLRLVIEPAVRAPHDADRSQAMTALTQAWSDVVESYIRRYPEQWVWMHRRWKTQPSSATSDKRQATVRSEPSQGPVTSISSAFHHRIVACCLLLVAVLSSVSLVAALGGCSKPRQTREAAPSQPTQQQATPDPNAAQQMSAFTLTGYAVDGTKRWELNGQGASVEGNIVTIHRPDGIGYDPARTAYLTASAAQVNQTNRHVRLEHDVTIHTSDGLWFTAPILHWIPDQDHVVTDTPVRIETDHMLLRGRGADGLTQLKQATILKDVEMVLNPSDHELPTEAPAQVTITCDGPLSFDYEHHVATFEQNVHVKDPNGDLYSDKLVAYLNEQTRTIRYAEATGRVRIHQQQNTALSERAIYEPAIGKITLVGKPSLLVYPSQDATAAQLSFGALASDKSSATHSTPDAPNANAQP